MTTRQYRQTDMEAPESVSLEGGAACVYSHRCPGKMTVNEDVAAVIPLEGAASIIAVADGLGGEQAGAHAAHLAIESLAHAVVSASDRGEPLRTAILNGIESGNEAIQALGIGAATTLAVVEIADDEIRPYHVGDSEILVVGGRGKVKLQTVSHSPVGYAVEAGILDQRAAIDHEHRHIVSNVVGSPDMRIEVGSPLRLARRDTVLLASDGLTDNLHLEEIVELARKGPSEKAMVRLVETAHERMRNPSASAPSKPDDLTIVLYRRTA
ncbi:MAG: serine/threonine protein phosphatase [Phycisphaeraceae bacterium]|nr:serine/threonine protein phosphatase [Phycisphaeraceae bacterium]